jgi:hypothetical protein
MIGDQEDMSIRLRAVLPTQWFPDSTPVLDALLSGFASGWSWIYGVLRYVQAQTRIATASDVWLDVIAMDFFGNRLVRQTDQKDSVFRNRISLELFRERGTRTAVLRVLQDLTGRAPIIFEPARPPDTGGYMLLKSGAACGLAYGIVGGWGSVMLPFQCFITAFRPAGAGISVVSGWNASGAGYGEGPIEYGNLSMIEGQVTDDNIYAAVASVLPVSTVGWTAIID